MRNLSLPLALTLTLGMLGACSLDVPSLPVELQGEGGLLANATATATPTPSGTIAPVQRVVKDITVQPDNLVIPEGTAFDVIAVVTYVDGSFDSNVTWSSSDNTVLSVNPTTGRLTGLKAGVASVVAQSPVDRTKRTTATVAVRAAEAAPAITRVVPTEATIRVGETVRLTAEIQLSNGRTSPNVTWQSGNTRVAMVSNGLVTGISAGTVTVTAIAQDEPTKRADAIIRVLAESGPALASPEPTATAAAQL